MKVIPLTKNKLAFVDDSDYAKLAVYSWVFNGRYASRKSSDNRTVYMHREILKASDNLEVDHINGNCLDNRRSNLRLANHQQNMRNQKPIKGKSSQYKGVSWDKSHNRWQSYIHINDYKKHIGYFKDEIQAARAYDAEAIKLFGEYARLNFNQGKEVLVC